MQAASNPAGDNGVLDMSLRSLSAISSIIAVVDTVFAAAVWREHPHFNKNPFPVVVESDIN